MVRYDHYNDYYFYCMLVLYQLIYFLQLWDSWLPRQSSLIFPMMKEILQFMRQQRRGLLKVSYTCSPCSLLAPIFILYNNKKKLHFSSLFQLWDCWPIIQTILTLPINKGSDQLIWCHHCSLFLDVWNPPKVTA